MWETLTQRFVESLLVAAACPSVVYRALLYPQVDIASLGRQRPRAAVIGLGHLELGALIRRSADPLGRFEFDQLRNFLARWL